MNKNEKHNIYVRCSCFQLRLESAWSQQPLSGINRSCLSCRLHHTIPLQMYIVFLNIFTSVQKYWFDLCKDPIQQFMKFMNENLQIPKFINENMAERSFDLSTLECLAWFQFNASAAAPQSLKQRLKYSNRNIHIITYSL